MGMDVGVGKKKDGSDTPQKVGLSWGSYSFVKNQFLFLRFAIIWRWTSR